MKKNLLFILGIILSLTAFAQPANDNCANAQAIGTLPTPQSCGPFSTGINTGANLTINGSLNGATSASPYVYTTGCTGNSTSMATLANEVWYTFVASGFQVNINLTGTVANPNIAVWSGTCGSLGGGVGGCTVGANNGSATLSVGQLIPGTRYYIQISGNSATGSGNFSFTINNSVDCQGCMQTSSFTATPLPVNGAYNPGQTVNFCYHVDEYTETNTNWMHGVQLSFGSGWNAASLTTTPAAPWGNDGTWNYYPSGITDAQGTAWPAGWYFDRGSSPDGNPGNNFGDEIENNTGVVPSNVWNFCFSLTVKSACSPGSNLSITINTSGDGESGSWSNNGCNDDPGFVFPAIGACCPPIMSSTSTCINTNEGTATASPVGTQGPFTIAWYNSSNVLVQTTSGIPNGGSNTISNLAPGTYTVFVTDKNNCQVQNTVTVNSTSAITPTFNNVGPYCQGASIATLPTTSTNGITGTWSPVINNNATTVYTFTPLSTAGCATTKTLSITINIPTTPTFTQVPAICTGSSLLPLPTTSTNNITGSWSPVINNTTTTLYTFNPTAGQCANSAQMTISVNNNTLPTFTQVPDACEGSVIAALPTTSNNAIVGSWLPATVNTTTTTTYNFTPNPNQCAIGTTMTITITPKITPTFTQIGPFCTGTSISLPSSSNNNAITGTWSPSIDNTATTLYTFTPSAGQCANTTTMQVVISNGTPSTFNALTPICAGETLTLPATSAEGFTGTWLPAISNTTSQTYTFTPTAGQCAVASTLTSTVNLVPSLTVVSSQTVCAGQQVNGVPFSSSVANTTIDWLNTESGVGLASNGTGDITAFLGTNSGNATLTGVITATPTAGSCTGSPVTFSITVNPIPSLSLINSQTVCTGNTVNGITYATSLNGSTVSWTNTESATGLSLNGNGNIADFTGLNTGNTTLTSVVTATPSLNGCDGAPKTFSITVKPVPTLSTINNQTVCAGQPVSAINYSSTVTGSIINWANTETGIGLAASGNGNIGSFTSTNNSGAPLIALITANPSVNGCTGSPVTFSITVNPIPSLSTINNQTVCAGNTVNGITYATSLNGSTVSWTNTESATGLSLNGNGNIADFTGLNTGNTTLTSVVTATPSLNGCDGVPQTYTIIVNPIPVLSAIPNQTVCAGQPVSAINYSSTVTGSIINWANTETGIGLAASGNGNIGSFTSTNNSGAPLIALITANPSANGCDGTPITFTITVNNQILPDFTLVPSICNGGTLNPLPTTSINNISGSWVPPINNTTTTTYTFTPIVGQCATTATMTIGVGSNVVPSFDQVNPVCAGGILNDLPTVSNNGLTGSWSPPVNNFITTTYSFTPAPNQCALETQMTIQVNLPITPQFTAVNPYCAGSIINPLPQTSDNGINGQWLPPINNLTTTTYSFTPSSGLCATTSTMQIIIHPKPSLSDVTPTDETCGGSNGILTINSINGGTSPYQYSLNNAPFVSTNSFTTLDSGSYVIIVRDANLCLDTLITSITNYPGPTAAQFSTTDADCGVAIGSITVDGVSGGTSPYQYNFNNTGFTSTPTIGQLTTGNFMVVIKDANGCILDSLIQVTGDSQVNADFNLSPQVGTVPVWASFTNTSTTPSVQFTWNLGLSNVDTVAFQPNTQIYDVHGIYTITQIASNGNPACNDTMVKLLYVELDPFISVPTIFSPNGDGSNEEFFIQSRGYIDLKVTIFNRWGNIINSFDGVLGSWDGKDTSGNEVSEGTYYYFISGKRFDAEPFEAHGYMMLVR